jgi:hypothetical protein
VERVGGVVRRVGIRLGGGVEGERQAVRRALQLDGELLLGLRLVLQQIERHLRRLDRR